MIETLKKFKYLIIVVLVLVAAFIAYTIYTNGNSTTGSATLQKTAVNTTRGSVAVPGSLGPGSAVSSDELAKSFVDQLLVIQNIDLKIEFFSDPIFLALVDNHKGIDSQLIGRPNPFAPIGKDVGQTYNNYQDVDGSVKKSTGGIPVGTESDSSVSSTDATATTTKAVATTTVKTTNTRTTNTRATTTSSARATTSTSKTNTGTTTKTQ